MKIEKKDGSKERRILTAMIVDTRVVSRIASRWNGELFGSSWANLVGGWCVDYYRKYSKSPGRSIEAWFETWATENRDRETMNLLDRFLQDLSSDYEAEAKTTNAEYTIDFAADYFNEIAAMKLKERIEGHVANGDVTKAIEDIGKFGRVEMGRTGMIDVLSDTSAQDRVFERRGKPLIEYPDGLGNFFGSHLCEDGFLAFMGREKIGKTYWLLDIAWRAMQAGHPVAFFEVGDLSEEQIMERFLVRAARRPLERGIVKYPSLIDRDGNFSTVDYEERVYEDDLDPRDGKRFFSEIRDKLGKKNPLLRLSVHPNDSLSIEQLHAILQEEERYHGWVPRVIVVDYADILAMPQGYFRDSRDAIHKTWQRMRRLSQIYHCLFVTASQTDADSYTMETLTMSNFSEDKRKFAETTGVIGINQTDEEKERGVQRLNWIVRRNGQYNIRQCVHVASCLEIANPAVRSIF